LSGCSFTGKGPRFAGAGIGVAALRIFLSRETRLVELLLGRTLLIAATVSTLVGSNDVREGVDNLFKFRVELSITFGVTVS